MSKFEQQLEKVRTAPGFIAALDQSGGSTPKALANYGVDSSAYSNDDEMFDVIHAMRTRIVTSPAFNGDRIMGAILFENTVDLEVTETTPSIKGATAQAQTKPAVLETGITVQVPPYIEAGEKVRVDTRDGRFVGRA